MPQVEIKSIQLPNGKEAQSELLPGRMSWGEGSIVAPDLSPEQLAHVQNAVTESLVAVDATQLSKSGCTDGRGRLGLLDGSEAPVWQKTVGTDLLTLFAMAEALPRQFYAENEDKPALSRLDEVIKLMTKNNDTPTTHVGCGARAGFPAIISNAVRLAGITPEMRSQIIAFGNGKVTNETIDAVSETFSHRAYQDWDADAVQAEVQQKSGPQAIKTLVTDDSPNHGHNEAVIVRLSTPGIAFSARKFIELMQSTDDPQLQVLNAFSLNDDRIENLASIISETDEQFATALTAGLLYSEAGWATLGKDQYVFKITDKQLPN